MKVSKYDLPIKPLDIHVKDCLVHPREIDIEVEGFVRILSVLQQRNDPVINILTNEEPKLTIVRVTLAETWQKINTVSTKNYYGYIILHDWYVLHIFAEVIGNEKV